MLVHSSSFPSKINSKSLLSFTDCFLRLNPDDFNLDMTKRLNLPSNDSKIWPSILNYPFRSVWIKALTRFCFPVHFDSRDASESNRSSWSDSDGWPPLEGHPSWDTLTPIHITLLQRRQSSITILFSVDHRLISYGDKSIFRANCPTFTSCPVFHYSAHAHPFKIFILSPPSSTHLPHHLTLLLWIPLQFPIVKFVTTFSSQLIYQHPLNSQI